MDRLYRAADVCVMPSVSEPLGLVALESLRNGTPCIIPRTAGVAEVLRHTLRVDFWDVDDMADKVIGVLRHPMLWQELSDGGLAEVTGRAARARGGGPPDRRVVRDDDGRGTDGAGPTRRRSPDEERAMPDVCFYFQVHQPYRLRRYRVFDIGTGAGLLRRRRPIAASSAASPTSATSRPTAC